MNESLDEVHQATYVSIPLSLNDFFNYFFS